MSDDDEIKDPLEAMDEEDGDDEDGDIDPKKLKKKGLHIEGDDDVPHDDGLVDPLLEKDPLLDDDGMPLDDEDEVELEDDEFSDKADW